MKKKQNWCGPICCSPQPPNPPIAGQRRAARARARTRSSTARSLRRNTWRPPTASPRTTSCASRSSLNAGPEISGELYLPSPCCAINFLDSCLIRQTPCIPSVVWSCRSVPTCSMCACVQRACVRACGRLCVQHCGVHACCAERVCVCVCVLVVCMCNMHARGVVVFLQLYVCMYVCM